MDRLKAFDFFTVLLPGMIVTSFLFYLWKGDAFFIKDGPFLNLVFVLIPIYLFVGHLLSFFGAKLEGWIDWCHRKLDSKIPKHPIQEILPVKYPKVLANMCLLFSDIVCKGGEEDKYYDSLFDKCRVLLYQQTYGERAQGISSMATFYRNLVATAVVILIILFCFKSTLINSHIDGHNLFVGIVLLVISIGVYSRIISQTLYKRWFHEVLKNIEIYFLTLNHKKNEGQQQP